MTFGKKWEGLRGHVCAVRQQEDEFRNICVIPEYMHVVIDPNFLAHDLGAAP